MTSIRTAKGKNKVISKNKSILDFFTRLNPDKSVNAQTLKPVSSDSCLNFWQNTAENGEASVAVSQKMQKMPRNKSSTCPFYKWIPGMPISLHLFKALLLLLMLSNTGVFLDVQASSSPISIMIIMVDSLQNSKTSFIVVK